MIAVKFNCAQFVGAPTIESSICDLCGERMIGNRLYGERKISYRYNGFSIICHQRTPILGGRWLGKRWSMR